MDIKHISQKIHQTAKEKGFWDRERNFGELLMLVTSELGEALEAHRKGRFANKELFDKEIQASPFHEKSATIDSFKLHIKDTVEDEIADAVIRLFDLAEGLNIDLEFHIAAKIRYNQTREKLHGKKY